MSIDKITSKILNEAEAAGADTLAAAKSKCDGILAEASAKATKLLTDTKKKSEEEKEKLITRRQSVADIDSKKVVLAQKQQLIAECYEKAENKLASMKEEQYLKLLVSLGKASGETAGELIFNERDNTAIGGKVVEALNKEVKGGNFTLSNETRAVKGGYLISGGHTFINNTVEALVEQYKAELTVKVAEMLFSQQ